MGVCESHKLFSRATTPRVLCEASGQQPRDPGSPFAESAVSLLHPGDTVSRAASGHGVGEKLLPVEGHAALGELRRPPGKA